MKSIGAPNRQGNYLHRACPRPCSHDRLLPMATGPAVRPDDTLHRLAMAVRAAPPLRSGRYIRLLVGDRVLDAQGIDRAPAA